MQIPDLNPNERAWDRWRAFHWSVRPDHVMTIFDTNEVVVNFTSPRARRKYEDLNIRLCATTGADCPSLATPDGRVLPAAWLQMHGLQEILIDYDTRHVVSLEGRFKTKDKPAIPTRFVSDYGEVLAYFAGPGVPPVGAMQIKVCPPVLHKAWYTPEEIAHCRDIVSAAKACAALSSSKDSKPTAVYAEQLLNIQDVSELSDAACQGLLKHGLARSAFWFDSLRLA